MRTCFTDPCPEGACGFVWPRRTVVRCPALQPPRVCLFLYLSTFVRGKKEFLSLCPENVCTRRGPSGKVCQQRCQRAKNGKMRTGKTATTNNRKKNETRKNTNKPPNKQTNKQTKKKKRNKERCSASSDRSKKKKKKKSNFVITPPPHFRPPSLCLRNTPFPPSPLPSPSPHHPKNNPGKTNKASV